MRSVFALTRPGGGGVTMCCLVRGGGVVGSVGDSEDGEYKCVIEFNKNEGCLLEVFIKRVNQARLSFTVSKEHHRGIGRACHSQKELKNKSFKVLRF